MIKLEVLTTSLGCAKCERAMQIINDVVKKYKGKIRVVKTDVVKNPEKLLKFGVMTMPVIIINGKVAFEGAPSKEKLAKKIEEVIR